MRLNNVKLDENRIEVNLKFYTFLKELNSKKPKNDILTVLSDVLSRYSDDLKILKEQLENVVEKLTVNESYDIADMVESFMEMIDTPIISKGLNVAIKLYDLKGYFLEETKLHTKSQSEKLFEIPLLSLKYDSLTKYIPYTQRVSGALLTAIFFDKITNGHKDLLSEISEEYVNDLINECKYLSKNGVNLEHMFSLMFQESINQSIKSTAGGSYEDRITQYLISIGIPNENIEKVHDSEDNAFEIDHKVNLNGKIIAISAKRTLRERYKQFIKTVQTKDNVDALVTITLGTDLTKDKAIAIRNHGVYIFIADEVLLQNKELKNIKGVFAISDLSLTLLEQLVNEDI